MLSGQVLCVVIKHDLVDNFCSCDNKMFKSVKRAWELLMCLCRFRQAVENNFTRDGKSRITYVEERAGGVISRRSPNKVLALSGRGASIASVLIDQRQKQKIKSNSLHFCGSPSLWRGLLSHFLFCVRLTGQNK